MRAGEGDAVQLGMASDGAAGFHAAANQVENPRGHACIAIDLCQQAPGQRGVGAGFIDHRIPRKQRRRGHSHRERDGEVERCDDAEHAEGAHLVECLLARIDAVEIHVEALRLFHEPGIGADDVDRFLDLADCLHPRFSDLEQASCRNLVFTILQHIRSLAQHRHPMRPARCSPLWLGAPCRGECAVHGIRIGGNESTEGQAAIDRALCRHLSARAVILPVDQVGLILAQHSLADPATPSKWSCTPEKSSRILE